MHMWTLPEQGPPTHPPTSCKPSLATPAVSQLRNNHLQLVQGVVASTPQYYQIWEYTQQVHPTREIWAKMMGEIFGKS